MSATPNKNLPRKQQRRIAALTKAARRLEDKSIRLQQQEQRTSNEAKRRKLRKQIDRVGVKTMRKYHKIAKIGKL